MNWRGKLGAFLLIIYAASTMYQLINWDNEYWKLVMNITFAILGLSMVIEDKKIRDGELIIDKEPKPSDNWKQYQKPKEDE